jgi:hypothetical protein
MPETAFQKQYRQEYVAGFEFGQSLLRAAVTTEHMRQGNEAIFLVADSGGATAVTRGVNGRIPARGDNNNQFTATLQEWHDLVNKTSFNIFASQGNQRKIMQDTSLKVMNKKIDDDIIAELATGTVNTGAATTGSLALVTKALGILGNADVDVEEEDNMFGLMTPAMEAYLLRDASFTSADYVDVKPLVGPAKKFRRWAGVNWIKHTRLPGKGTNAEKTFIFHRAAIGHAFDNETLKAVVGYEEEQDYSFARVSNFMGSKLLQNSGVVVMNHDGSAIVAA